MDRVAAGREYVFQQNSAPPHKARKTQAWLYRNLCHHWSPDLWPPSSPDYNPLDYYMWGVVEAKVNANPHNAKDSLRASIMEVMRNMDKEEVKRICNQFKSRLEKVVIADGGVI
ncbi:hypothetical protein WH47_04243 [Habropoda laboriosa]|uniref:Transposable element Tc1 transposase n=1 Tax=Habropoda laboriosa TaxID=597456 RepID=A0A0L7QVA9_9HYME|nr:hypothetical protein WH47_04243 [Habropoda laboriosa]